MWRRNDELAIVVSHGPCYQQLSLGRAELSLCEASRLVQLEQCLELTDKAIHRRLHRR